MNKIFLAFAIVLSIQVLAFTQTLPEFSKMSEVKPLESSRDDVRKILKDYQIIKSDDLLNFDHFSTNNAKIEVLYSDGKCSDKFFDFDVPAGKVVAINLMVTNGRFKASELGLNLSEFKRGSMYDSYIYNDDSGIVLSKMEERIMAIYFLPPKRSFSLLCSNEKAVQPISIVSLLKQFQRQKEFHLIREFANVIELIIDKNEVQKNCETTEENLQSSESQPIRVSMKYDNPYNDILDFHYTISGGKIIGKGADIIWDLSGVKAGAYTITAAVDDGCGFCGRTITKTVNIKECQINN